MNRIVHFEIHANDIARCVNFYKTVFGWHMEEWKGLGQEYWMVMTAPRESTEPGINGGLLIRGGKEPEQGMGPNAFVCTVQVDDIDATMKAIEAAGGTLQIPKFDIAGMAWQVYYKDTEGNIFGVHQTKTKENKD
ncbi:MAG TPA: VOC family protein [Candidatus Paceibacterota bacterium]|nr:VOC family protein [Candidatus Paceibacterota bacterium]